MLNRRSTLFNLVTLTITSNVSSTITCSGTTYSSVTSATFRIRQGTEVTWSVSASGYKSQSGSEVMSGNKDLSISLESSTAVFAINSNVSSTIVINGDSSTGVTSKSVTVNKGSEVNWSVSCSEYDTQSGSQIINENASISVNLVFNGLTYQCKQGYIYCTDGAFIHPSTYKSKAGSRTPYGYAITNTKVALLQTGNGGTNTMYAYGGSYENSSGHITEGTPLYNSSYINNPDDGVTNTRTIMSIGNDSDYIYYRFKNYYSSDNRHYIPAINELSYLYNCMFNGSMNTDLTTAGILNKCYYYETGGWFRVFSSTNGSSSTTQMVVSSDGTSGELSKYDRYGNAYGKFIFFMNFG